MEETWTMPKRIGDDFDRVFKFINMKVNVGKKKAIVFERAKQQTTDFVRLHT